MSVTAKNIKDCFAEFAGLTDAAVDKWRLQAERRVNLVQWGNKSDDAILWLTAHLLKLDQQHSRGAGSAAAGPVTEKKVGDLSVRFMVSEKLSSSWLARTSYGQYFMELKTGIFATRVLA